MGNGLQGFSIQADFFPISNLEIERAVIKKYRSKLWAPFIRALLFLTILPIVELLLPTIALTK